MLLFDWETWSLCAQDVCPLLPLHTESMSALSGAYPIAIGPTTRMAGMGSGE